MTKVVPAIQPKTQEDYRSMLKIARQLTDRFQLDIISSDFYEVPTIPLGEIESVGGLMCDIHIMSKDPKGLLDDAKRLHPHLIILQAEDVDDIENLLNSLKEAELKVGVAINPSTSVESIEPLLPILDHILIMAYPAGPSGQKFQPSVLHKVAQVRSICPNIEVGLDGGVNGDTLEAISRAKFDIVNVTTYLFGAADPLERYSELIEAFT